MWDPAQYQRYAGERARPFFDLLARVAAVDPAYVVDLGCGPGNLTAALAERWPGAEIWGVDNSPEMIREASALVRRGSPDGRGPGGESGPREGEQGREEPGHGTAGNDRGSGSGLRGRLNFVLCDVREWQADRPVDVLFSNAVLQWVPGHTGLLLRWAGMLAREGWLAFQLPANFDQPAHTILRELAGSGRWRPLLEGAVFNRQASDPAAYLDLLARAGCEVDAWETTYLHVLHGADPVLEWYKGTALRPVLASLGPRDADQFLGEYAERVREAYPAAPYGTVLPFRRVFVVARKA